MNSEDKEEFIKYLNGWLHTTYLLVCFNYLIFITLSLFLIYDDFMYNHIGWQPTEKIHMPQYGKIILWTFISSLSLTIITTIILCIKNLLNRKLMIFTITFNIFLALFSFSLCVTFAAIVKGNVQWLFAMWAFIGCVITIFFLIFIGYCNLLRWPLNLQSNESNGTYQSQIEIVSR